MRSMRKLWYTDSLVLFPRNKRYDTRLANGNEEVMARVTDGEVRCEGEKGPTTPDGYMLCWMFRSRWESVKNIV